MGNIRWLSCIIISSLFVFLTSSAQSKSITIGPAELLYTEDEIPIRYDGSMSTIQKDANTMYFFHSFGCRFDPGEKRRSRHSWFYGPPLDPLKTHDFSKTEEDFWDYNGYYQDTEQEGVWILGIYKRNNGDLLAITHSEVTYASDKTKFHFSIGLGYSVNNGKSWTYCGEIARAADDTTNVGGGAYIIVGDYLYVYYNDGIATNDTEEAERRSRRQCVARARLDDVLKKASNHKVGTWYKYKDGHWDTPGLSNTAGTDLIPKVYGAEDVHSDAAYCTALGKYLLTVQTHKAHKLLLFSSTDGIKWTREAIVDETDDDIMQPYSCFVDYNGPTADCREVDGSFYIYYPRKRFANDNQDDMFRRLITIK